MNFATCSNFFQDEASRAGLGMERTADLAVALNEVATNALKHAGGRARVRMWTETAQVICEVSDSGSGFSGNPFTGHVPPSGRAAPGWVSGPRGKPCHLVHPRSA